MMNRPLLKNYFDFKNFLSLYNVIQFTYRQKWKTITSQETPTRSNDIFLRMRKKIP